MPDAHVDDLLRSHLELDELADLAVGELPAEATAAAEAHLAACPACRTEWARLGLETDRVAARLRAEPGPAMPVTVAARLDRALAVEESARRGRGGGVVRMMLAAVVGFGGFVLSSTAGLNEPAAPSPTMVQPALASQAQQLAASRDLDAHPFSAAWRCARSVTTGRITGITPVYVEGEQAFLVYTRSAGRTYATLVGGCGEGTPTAGNRVALTE